MFSLFTSVMAAAGLVVIVALCIARPWVIPWVIAWFGCLGMIMFYIYRKVV